MIHTAQTINEMCTEIFSCLNKNHLELFVEMIKNDVDISAFLMREGSVLNDTEKEMSVVSRFKRMVEGVDGEFIDKECMHDKCIYRRTYDMIQSFFQTYQSTTSNQFTEYDLEQMEHAYKNVQTMKRLLNTYLTNDLLDTFDLMNILTNILHNKIGIDVSYIRYLMEQSSIVSQRSAFIGQLSNIESSIDQIKKLIITDSDTNTNDMITGIDENINSLRQQDNAITTEIDRISSLLTNNEQNKTLLYQVKNININELNKQKSTLSDLIRRLDFDTASYSTLEQTYNNLSIQFNSLSNEIKVLNDAYNQYVSTNAEIEKSSSVYEKYRIIAEATSSTKGKPVITIRDTVEHALTLTNRLLNIMYDGEIELLEPTIDESSFSLPFRSGSHTSPDIKYGSQSENTLLSLALELSLSSSLTHYDVPLIDELDAYLDDVTHESFLLMIQEMMATLKIEQLFLISHNIQPGQYDHIVHVVDISKK
jgi:DNA repair exonuclease SbcCD ATPase subunit